MAFVKSNYKTFLMKPATVPVSQFPSYKNQHVEVFQGSRRKKKEKGLKIQKQYNIRKRSFEHY